MNTNNTSSQPAEFPDLDQVALRTWGVLAEIPPDATEEEIHAWLGEPDPKDRQCPYCQREHLKRYEALNARCESCRTKYVSAAEEPADLAKRLRESNIPPACQAMTLATFDGRLPERLQQFLDRPTGKVLIMGPTGLGKTHATCAILRRLSDEGLTVFWADAALVVHKILSEKDVWLEGRLRNARVVALDDVGREADAGVLERIIRHRDLQKLPTLLNTNLEFDSRTGKHPIEQGNPALWRRLSMLRPVRMNA